MATGGEIVCVASEIAEHTAKQYQRYDRPRGTMEWPALLRLMDRKDAGYKS